jgi:hypothetical protein
MYGPAPDGQTPQAGKQASRVSCVVAPWREVSDSEGRPGTRRGMAARPSAPGRSETVAGKGVQHQRKPLERRKGGKAGGRRIGRTAREQVCGRYRRMDEQQQQYGVAAVSAVSAGVEGESSRDERQIPCRSVGLSIHFQFSRTATQRNAD